MTELYSHPDYTRVGYLESALKEAGIACFVQNAASHALLTGIPSPLFYPRLCITNDEDLERAQEILAPLIGGASDTDETDWTCPKCGESVPENFDTCWKCGWQTDQEGEKDSLSEEDKVHLWHPFTPMEAWCAEDHHPLVLVRGKGCRLYDSQNRSYLDGNSTIWTNIHGHAHPKINQAINRQLKRLAHVSFLGFTHPLAIQLARELVELAPGESLTKVFFSDNGSTSVESALRMALQYWRQNGRPERDLILAFENAYHGDTLGAASLGGLPLFKGSANQFGYAVHRVSGWEELQALPAEIVNRVAAVIIEPLMQGAAGMRAWPVGLLQKLAAWRTEHDTFLILDEVMTAFGRTGKMFACEHEQVIPDFLCAAKGLTGGYLPLAVTLTTQRVFDGFLGDASRAFYYGHSYTANPVGCAAALASLAIFREEKVLGKLPEKIAVMKGLLDSLRELPHVGEIRQRGLIAGIDVVQDQATGTRYPAEQRTGAKLCMEARQHGLLTRPIGDTLVLMPPLCVSLDELAEMVRALRKAIIEICGS